MSRRKLAGIIFGSAAILVVGFIIYKLLTEKEVGFQEVVVIGSLWMMFFSTITWGNKEEKDGIYIDEELGKRITEKSSKISYFILIAFIIVMV